MFNQNKKKINSRIRFQNTGFKHRLQAQRGYKRQARALPDTDWAVFFSKIGLGSWVSRIATLLIFFLLIYVIYIPNFLFIKHINITGVSGNDLVSAQSTVNSYLNKPLPWPQKNLILLSKFKLNNFLISNNKKILKVNSINKKFPSTLVIRLEPRTDEFAVQTPLAFYTVSGDGLITGERDFGASGTLPSLPILIKIDKNDSFAAGQRIFSQGTTDFVKELNNRLPTIVKNPISEYQLATAETPDIIVYFKNGFRTMFDATSDLNKILTRFTFLVNQYSEADFKKLDYIDMRFEGRGYVCSKGNPCVKDINLPNNASTTQPTLSN